MKSFTLNKNSWHYWLANSINRHMDMMLTDGSNNSLDFCSYVKLVVKGAFTKLMIGIAFALVFSLVSLLLVGFGTSVYQLGFWFSNGVFDHSIPSLFVMPMLMFCMMLCAVLLFTVPLLISKGFEELDNYSARRPLEQKADSFIVLLYRKIKDKTCVKVNFK